MASFWPASPAADPDVTQRRHCHYVTHKRVGVRDAIESCDATLICLPHGSLDVIDDPHNVENVDFAVLTGEFVVAENGAVWVTDETLKHRVLHFITQHLALVVSSKNIVNNMHEAYKRLSFDGRRFGTFISGPSKTADIEQSLVIGAHGPRSHVVFLVDDDS